MVGGKSDENLGAGCRGRILRTRPVAGTVPGVSNCAPLTTYFEILHLSAGRRLPLDACRKQHLFLVPVLHEYPFKNLAVFGHIL